LGIIIYTPDKTYALDNFITLNLKLFRDILTTHHGTGTARMEAFHYLRKNLTASRVGDASMPLS